VSDDLLERVRVRARENSFWRYLGVEVVEARDGWVRLRVPVRDELRNAAGAPVHGGVYSALVDMAVGVRIAFATWARGLYPYVAGDLITVEFTRDGGITNSGFVMDADLSIFHA